MVDQRAFTHASSRWRWQRVFWCLGFEYSSPDDSLVVSVQGLLVCNNGVSFSSPHSHDVNLTLCIASLSLLILFGIEIQPFLLCGIELKLFTLCAVSHSLTHPSADTIRARKEDNLTFTLNVHEVKVNEGDTCLDLKAQAEKVFIIIKSFL